MIRQEMSVVYTVICHVHSVCMSTTGILKTMVLCNPFMQEGQNALHLAAQGGHVNTMRYLVPKMNSLLHSTDHEGYTVLHWAAQKGHANVVRLLLEEYNLDPTVSD